MKLRYIVGLIISFLVMTPGVFGYGISPMNMTLEPFGKGSANSFYLENKSDDAVQIEISISKRMLDENGVETTANLDPKEDAFEFFPPMLTLKPHDKRAVRVFYKGNPDAPKEKAYRMFVTQLDIRDHEKEKGKNTMHFLMRYEPSLYVASKESKSDVNIVETTRVSGKDGTQKLKIVFRNKGTAHENLTDYNIKLRSKKGDHAVLYTISWSALNKLQGQKPLNVFAGQNRVLFLDWQTQFPNENVMGEIEHIEN